MSVQELRLTLADGDGDDVLGVWDDEGGLQLIGGVEWVLIQVSVQLPERSMPRKSARPERTRWISLGAGIDAHHLGTVLLVPGDEGVGGARWRSFFRSGPRGR